MPLWLVGSNPTPGVSEYGVNDNMGGFQPLVVGLNPAIRIVGIVDC